MYPNRTSLVVMVSQILIVLLVSVAPQVGTAAGSDRNADGTTNIKDLILLLSGTPPIPSFPNDLFVYLTDWYVTSVTFDFKDYFPLTANSTWHYIGFNGGSAEDNFRWTVEATQQNVGGGKMAARMRTNTDEPTDDRNLDVDFWYLKPDTGEVFFYGLHVGSVKGSGLFTVPIQDIILTDPLRVGTDGMEVGVAPPPDTGAGKVSLNTPFGLKQFDGTFTATVNPSAIIPLINTPLGDFTNVLRIVISINATAFGQSYSFENSTFFLKKNVGMVAQDQTPDENDAQLQGIDSGTVYVGGNPVPVVAN
jgi:hypothetical protein